MGLDPNTPNMTPNVNTGKSVSPVNVFKIAIIVSVVLVGSYGLFINKNAFLIACLIIQCLFITLLTVMAILGIKDKAEVKKNLSYVYLVVALFSLILGIISFLEVLKYR